MNWSLTTDRPIYAQLVDLIQRGILSGTYPLGSNMPSVRVLALEASVNPNTMQKALAELENQGLLYTQRTSGRSVTTDEGLIMEVKERIASRYIEEYFMGMQSLGIERVKAADMLISQAKGPEGSTAAAETSEAASAAAAAASAAAAAAAAAAATPPAEEAAEPAPATTPTASAPAAADTQAPQTTDSSSTNTEVI